MSKLSHRETLNDLPVPISQRYSPKLNSRILTPSLLLLLIIYIHPLLTYIKLQPFHKWLGYAYSHFPHTSILLEPSTEQVTHPLWSKKRLMCGLLGRLVIPEWLSSTIQWANDLTFKQQTANHVSRIKYSVLSHFNSKGYGNFIQNQKSNQ